MFSRSPLPSLGLLKTVTHVLAILLPMSWPRTDPMVFLRLVGPYRSHTSAAVEQYPAKAKSGRYECHGCIQRPPGSSPRKCTGLLRPDGANGMRRHIPG